MCVFFLMSGTSIAPISNALISYSGFSLLTYCAGAHDGGRLRRVSVGDNLDVGRLHVRRRHS